MGVQCEQEGAHSPGRLSVVVLKPRVLSFPTSLMEEIVLNADLKSANSILM